MKRKNFIQSSIGALTASYLPALPKFQTIEDEALFVSPAFLKDGIYWDHCPAVILPARKFDLPYKKWKVGVIRSRSAKR
jgi:hypothetical protein